MCLYFEIKLTMFQHINFTTTQSMGGQGATVENDAKIITDYEILNISTAIAGKYLSLKGALLRMRKLK